MPDLPRRRPRDAWPTAAQETLLRAALAAPAIAVEAWRSWLRDHSLDDADGASSRLFPLVYDHLWAHAPELPEGARLKGLYRHTWARNQVQSRQVATAIDALTRADIPTLVVKGLALQVVAYGGRGARAMEDGDIVVPRDRAVEAGEVLTRRGWRPAFPPLAREMRCRASTPYIDAHGGNVDLHWHVLYDDMREGADAGFWAASEPLQIGETATRTLAPADHLLHTLAHGLAWAPIPPLRWVADAVRLVRATGASLDWDRFWHRAAFHQIEWLVSPGLLYVERLLPATLPPSVVARARADRPSLDARLEFACRMRGRAFLPGYLPRFWRHFRRALPASRYGRGPIGFIRYAADTARVEHSWQTPWLLARAFAEKRASSPRRTHTGHHAG